MRAGGRGGNGRNLGAGERAQRERTRGAWAGAVRGRWRKALRWESLAQAAWRGTPWGRDKAHNPGLPFLRISTILRKAVEEALLA